MRGPRCADPHDESSLVGVVVATCVACGDGNSGSVGPGPEGSFLTEHEIHETGVAASLSRPVVLRLEGDGTVVHSGDIGGVGSDTFGVTVEGRRRLEFAVAADAQDHLAASLVDAQGRVLATIDAHRPAGPLDLAVGEYQVQISRWSQGTDPIVFVRDGRVSRSCDGCELRALQAGAGRRR